MTVFMPGQPPRKIVKQGSVRGTAVDGSDEGDVSVTAPAASATASTSVVTWAQPIERPTRATEASATTQQRGPRHAERPARGSWTKVWDASKTSAGKGSDEAEKQRSPPRRGTYITFLEGFHGQGAVGAMSLTMGAENLGITWQGGFDMWAAATDLVRERHGFEPLNADANDVFEQTEILPRADVGAMGSPCQQASWAAWVATQGTERQCAPPDGDHPMNQLYWKQVQPMKRRVKALLIEFLTGVLKVASASDPTAEPGFLHHKMLKEIETADETVGVSAWTHEVWCLNSHFHGSEALRRRLYTFGLSPDVVEAAERAGVEFPAPPIPVPFSERRVLADALVPTAIIDKFHGHLYVNETITPRLLRGDGTDRAQAARIWTGQREPEPVSDVRLPSLPLKCYGNFPLIMLPDGRVRRLLPTEFLAVGGQAWSVGWGLSGVEAGCDYDKEELERLKTLGGNTWDAALARITVTALAIYMQPYLAERAAEPAEPERTAARFACLLNRVRLPARRALRRWRSAVGRYGVALRLFRAAVEDVITRLRARRIRRRGGQKARPPTDDEDNAGMKDAGSGVPSSHMRSGPCALTFSPSGDVFTPGPAAGQSKSSSMFLTARLDAELTTAFGFTRCTHVDEDGMPMIRRTHTEKMWGALMASDAEVICARLEERPEVELRPPPVTRMRPEPHIPTAAEQAAFSAECPTRPSCYMPSGRRKQDAYDHGMRMDADGIKQHGTEGPDAWRVRVVMGTEQGETRIYQDEYAPAVRGNIVEFDEHDKPRLMIPVPIRERMAPGGSVKVRLDKFKAYMLKIGWSDKELYSTCDWGHWDKSDGRPLVTSLSGNQKAAYENFEGTCAAHALEVKKGWTTVTQKVPYVGTMHMCPTNVVPKSNGTMRLLGHASHPMPGSVLDTVHGVLIAPNRATDPELMPGYDWASIEEFAEAVAVMVAIAQMARGWLREEGDRFGLLLLIIVCGSRDDLTKWFRQIPVCSADMHKQVYNWAAQYLTDGHVQMGRVSSADGAQRVSLLARRRLWDAVEEELRRRLRDDKSALWDVLRRVTAQRSSVACARHTGLWALDLMQDDLAWVALTREVGDLIREMTVTVMEEYGVEVSVEKRLEDEATVDGPQPNPVVLFIGGLFDTTDLDAITRGAFMRAQEKTLARMEVNVAEWEQYPPGKLAPRELMQTTVGMAFFHGRFGVRVRRRINSGIRLLRGRDGAYVAVSKEWKRDLASMWAEFQMRRGVALVRDPVWWHPGLLGCNSDASRPDERADGGTIERGFGGNALHVYFFGAWTDDEVRYLDISTLELIAAGFLLLIAHLAGMTRTRMIMRCDNEAACRVVNDHAADSVAMAEALVWFEAVQQFVGVEVLLHHIAGKDNTVADDLSRDEVERAIRDLRRMSGTEPVHWEVPPEWRDISVVVKAARRAARA